MKFLPKSGYDMIVALSYMKAEGRFTREEIEEELRMVLLRTGTVRL